MMGVLTICSQYILLLQPTSFSFFFFFLLTSEVVPIKLDKYFPKKYIWNHIKQSKAVKYLIWFGFIVYQPLLDI